MKRRLKETLSESRWRHTEGVVRAAERMAEKFGVNVEKAHAAALLHDCAKCMPLEDMLAAADAAGVQADALERSCGALMHAAAGAALARTVYGVTDPEILGAIRFHTVGRANMTALEKVIFVSDFVEEGRRPFPGLDEARRLSMENLDAAVSMCARLSVEYVRARGETLHPATLQLINKVEVSMNQTQDLALKIAKILDNKKAENITILKVDHLTSITDYFVIATGRSAQAVHALYEEVTDKLAEEGLMPRRNDGVRESRWIVLDYLGVIVHIFHPEERQYYNIERLWMDGTNQVPFVQMED